jgi:hypothetical protein
MCFLYGNRTTAAVLSLYPGEHGRGPSPLCGAPCGSGAALRRAVGEGAAAAAANSGIAASLLAMRRVA